MEPTDRKPLLLIAGIGVLFLILIAIVITQAVQFHLVSTNPKTNSQPNQYTAISFKFNKPLDTGSQHNLIAISPSAAGKVEVSGNTVTFTPESTYQANTTYQVTLSNVLSAKGEKAANVTLSFTPVYVPYNQLPKDIQQRLVTQTDINDNKPKPYTPDAIAIAGSSELINDGLSSEQLIALKQAFFQYFQANKQEVRGMSVTNITKTLHDHAAGDYSSLNFDVTLDNKTAYKAKVVMINLTAIQLTLFDNSGAKLFDSGTIDSHTQGVD